MTLVLIVYWGLLKPFEVAFNNEKFPQKIADILKRIDIIVQVWFFIDILISLSTGYNDKGIIVMRRKKIVIHYLKTWFIIDLISSIPFYWFFFHTNKDILEIETTKYKVFFLN